MGWDRAVEADETLLERLHPRHVRIRVPAKSCRVEGTIPRHISTVGSYGGALSDERGTPVNPNTQTPKPEAGTPQSGILKIPKQLTNQPGRVRFLVLILRCLVHDLVLILPGLVNRCGIVNTHDPPPATLECGWKDSLLTTSYWHHSTGHLIRTSIYDKYPDSMKVDTHLDHTSHCSTASGTN